MSKGYYLTFSYAVEGTPAELGRGTLELHNDSLVPWSGAARTGSVHGGQLLYPCPPGTWFGVDPPVDTTERGMVLEGHGWKWRLYRRRPDGTLETTHYLVHPDGNVPGTLGCVGLLHLSLDLRDLLAQIHRVQPVVPVFVNLPVHEEALCVTAR